MIKLIVGNKGTGKTKVMVDMINENLPQVKGNIVCIEKVCSLHTTFLQAFVLSMLTNSKSKAANVSTAPLQAYAQATTISNRFM